MSAQIRIRVLTKMAHVQRDLATTELLDKTRRAHRELILLPHGTTAPLEITIAEQMFEAIVQAHAVATTRLQPAAVATLVPSEVLEAVVVQAVVA